MSGLRGPVASEVGSRVPEGDGGRAVLVGGLSRGSEGGRRDGLLGVVSGRQPCTLPVPGRVTACGCVTVWRRVTLTACGRVRQCGVCVWGKRCVEVENHFHMKVTAVSTQQRKNVHQPWPLAT